MPRSNLATYLTPAARNDLEEIWLYSVAQWSVDQANRYMDTLEETFELLRMMPEIARERSEFTPPVRIHPSGRHIIVYQTDESRLTIFRILGQAQNWKTILRAIE